MPRQTSIHCRYCGILYLHYESICVLVCILCLLWSITEAVSSGSWPILFNVLTLNVAICIVLFHFSNFCFSLSSVAYFSNTGPRAPPTAGCTSFLHARRAMRFGLVVWVWVMVIFRYLYFILIYRSHPNGWAAVVPRSNYLILAVVSWDSSTPHLWGMLSLSSSAFTSKMLLPMASKVYLKIISPSSMY